MAPPGPPRLRNLILRLMPSLWAADAERDSRLWSTTCLTCGRVSNVWDMGGLRWRAHGRPRTSFFCPDCGRVRMHRIEWSGLGGPDGRADRSRDKA